MSRFLFHERTAPPPYDLDGVTTDWRVDPAVAAPTAAEDGPMGAYRVFAGTGGYTGLDPDAKRLGLSGYTVRFWARLDAVTQFAAGTPGAVVYRGAGGPSLADAWMWGVEAVATATTIGLRWVWENAAGVIEGAPVTIEIPSPGTWVLWSAVREITPDGSRVAFYANGQPIGELLAFDSAPPSATGTALTMGYRDNQGTPERFLYGDIAALQLVPRASSDLEEALIFRRWVDLENLYLAYDQLRLPGDKPTRARDSLYYRWRVVPLADALADSEREIERLRVAARPGQAYGAVLDIWERTFGLPAQGLLSERQRAAALAAVPVTSIDAETVKELAAQAFETPDSSFITLHKGTADVRQPEVASLLEQGNGTLTGGGASPYTIDITSTSDQRYIPGSLGAKTVEHGWGPPGDRGAMVTLTPDSGSGTTHFLAFMIRAGDARAAFFHLHLSLNEIRVRTWTYADGLGSPVTLASSYTASSVDLALRESGSTWILRYRDPAAGDDPTAWTDIDVTAHIPDDVSWAGFAAVSTISSSPALTHEVDNFRVHSPNSRSFFFLAVQASSAGVPDLSRAQPLMQKRFRASSLAGVTLDASLLCDSPGSFVGWSPTI